MEFDLDIAIIGGGIIGSSLAYVLSQKGDLSIGLIEQNANIKGENQSSRPSGVIHAGIYYPGETEPLKARLCVEGSRMLYAFCRQHGVPAARTGKLVVAVDDREEEYLEDLFARSRDNGVTIEKLSAAQVKEKEPNVRAQCALYVPDSGIVEPTALLDKLYHLAQEQGVMGLTSTKVVAIRPLARGFELVTRTSRGEKESFTAKTLLNAAGLFADDVARLFNPGFPFTVEPVRGESAKFYKSVRPQLATKMNVYPAPYGYFNETGEKAVVSFAEFKQLTAQGKITRTVGVHLTPTFDLSDVQAAEGATSFARNYYVGNTVTIGPVKTVGLGKEDYASQLKTEEVYADAVRSFFPHLGLEDISLHQTGIMAVPKQNKDFVIQRDEKYPDAMHFIIDSPGLTAGLAIAEYVSAQIRKDLS